MGSSAALNLVAALREAKRGPPGRRIVTVLCDGGGRHLTKFWSDEYVRKDGLEPAEDVTLQQFYDRLAPV